MISTGDRNFQIGDRLACWCFIYDCWQIGTIVTKFVGAFGVTDVLLMLPPNSPYGYMETHHIVNDYNQIWSIDDIVKI